jgi:hypothetical protein
MIIDKSIFGAVRAFTVGAALLALAGPGFAQSPESLIPGVIEQGKSLLEQQNPGLGKELREVAAKLRADMAPRQAELNNEVAKIYAMNFTAEEIKALLVFYKSPLGIKMVAEEPKALDRSMAYAQSWADKLSDEVMVMIRAEMKKRGHEI